MPEKSEAQAEDIILSAVLGTEAPGQQLIESDRVDQDDETKPEDEVGDETSGDGEQGKPAAKTEEKAAADPEEDVVEIAGEDGAEPQRIPLKEVLAGYQQHRQIEAQKAEIVARVEQEATTAARARLDQVEQYSRNVAAQLGAAMQLLQAPRAPDADAMLNPASPQYDPDAYHRQFAHYQRQQQLFDQTRQLGQHLLRQADDAREHAQAQREEYETTRLKALWPEWGQEAVVNKFIADMSEAYGYSPQELDESLKNHRDVIVARDALAYRQMKAQSGDVKAKVEAKAPKLVRTKQEAKAGGAQGRDAKGQFVADSKARAIKSGSDDDWARHFAQLSAAGRI